jgi:hypothetical protein
LKAKEYEQMKKSDD